MLITLVQYTDNDGNAPLSVQEPPMHQYYRQVHDVEVLSIENGDCEFNVLLNLDKKRWYVTLAILPISEEIYQKKVEQAQHDALVAAFSAKRLETIAYQDMICTKVRHIQTQKA